MDSLPFGEDTAETLQPDIPPELWIHSSSIQGALARQDAARAETEATAPPVSGTSQKDRVGGFTVICTVKGFKGSKTQRQKSDPT